jgi:EAL domain-containing protein (putative c-di-GMP-specific phosphodiesterase class I)
LTLQVFVPARSAQPMANPDRQSLIADRLARAMAQQRLHLLYQPEFDLLSGEVTVVEALCRWTDEELGTVAPHEFIPVAEANGLIAQLGQYVLQHVLHDLPALVGRWPQLRVAVNVSVIELEEPGFAAGLQHWLQAPHSFRARHLELEITESVFQRDTERVVRLVQSLRAGGVAIALDDFGTGHSSLSRLHELPFDKIKLDQSFVRALEHPMARSIVRGMQRLADDFERTLVAEGVETPAQLQHLLAAGCHFAQGYLLCRPVRIHELPERLDLK